MQASTKSKEFFLMKDSKIRKLVMAALLAALTYVATTVIKIPTPTGGWCC